MCALRIDIAPRVWDRRMVLKSAIAAAASWPVLGFPASAFAKKKVLLSGNPFSLGVASGGSFTRWLCLVDATRASPLEGGGMPAENIEVSWEVAHDEGFSKAVAKGTAVATPSLAHSVHVEVPGLDPDRWYFYRFHAAGETSPVGRARTTPAFGVIPERLRFAFASCQHFETGWYTAYQHMAAEDLDLVAHLGDYIYEGAGTDRKIRKHVGPLLHELVDFRNRHAQYKMDPMLQAAHAKCPWLVTWDDHEVANNYADKIPDREKETPEGLLTKRTNGYQAYYEHMPLRAAQLPKGPNMPLYRKVAYGQLAEFSVLDTRQYRTDQPCGDGNKQPCEAALAESATMLGAEQEKWLYDTLRTSRSRWNVLAQQVMMARVDRLPGEKDAYSMDQWPGYEANRLRILKFFGEHPQLNPVVLTGDIHNNWANNLQVNCADEKSPVVGTEFVGTSISSGGDGGESRKDTDAIYAENPFVKFFNNERGYVSCEVTPERWSTHYRTVPFVTKPDAPIVTRKTFVVENGRPGAIEA